MEREITVSPALIGAPGSGRVSPGMRMLVLALGHEVDRRGLTGPDVADAMWFRLDLRPLRRGRTGNFRLRTWLDKLMGLKIEGHGECPWGAVVVAEYHIEDGGASARVLVPPAAINLLRAPATYAKVEEAAFLRLSGAARELYIALADKKRLRQTHWDYDVEELRGLLGASGKKAYARWDKLSDRVLKPAVERINRLGLVQVEFQPLRTGRAITAVRFTWSRKSLADAVALGADLERASVAQGKPVDTSGHAPPLTDVVAPVDASGSGGPLSLAERRAVLDSSGASHFTRRPWAADAQG